MPNLVRTFTTVAALLACLAPGLSAQKTPASSDAEEIMSYRLTVQALRQYETVVRYLADWVKKDPEAQAHIKLQATVDSLRSKEDRTDAEQERLEKLEQRLEAKEKSSESETDKDPSIAEITAQITQFKPLVEALRRAGMTPREYVVFTLALFQAYSFADMKKSGLVKEIPKEVNAANVRFAEDNFAQLKALQDEMERINKGSAGVAKKGS